MIVMIVIKIIHLFLGVGELEVVLHLSKKNVTVNLIQVSPSATSLDIRYVLNRTVYQFIGLPKLNFLLLCNEDNTQRLLEQVSDVCSP